MESSDAQEVRTHIQTLLHDRPEPLTEQRITHGQQSFHFLACGTIRRLSETIKQVVAPPYDIIDAAGQKALHDRHPQNIIRLELGLDQPGDSPDHNRYTRAASTLRDWLKSGALKRDAQPAALLPHDRVSHRPMLCPAHRRKLSRAFSPLSNWKRSIRGIFTRMRIHARPPKPIG